jgi:hypothetical protein
MELSTEAKRSLAAWFGGGDTGSSSETLAVAALTGFAPDHASYPHDPSDFGRCARLIHNVPEVREAAFAALAQHGTVWPRLIEAWDDIHQCMAEECGIACEKGRRASKTYEAMQAIIYAKST